MRKIPCTMVIAGLFLAPAKASSAFSIPLPIEINSFCGWENLPKDEIQFRFQLMRSPVSPVFDADVEAYLVRYLTYGSKDTEEMLGRAAAMYPVIEHYLEMHGLPEQLKYLPMIESSFVSHAVSTGGAAGLWQFTPNTARHFGLSIDQYIDERKDPYKSTEAAIKYLKRLFTRFGSWELALAAYNCGPTRLSRTITAYGSNDFWKIKEGLPKETQRYVARYLAACYIGTFYQLHGLTPVADAMIYELMASRVYRPISLRQISEATGIDVAILKQMNPAFKKDHLPAKSSGIFLVLPRNAWNVYLDSQKKSGEYRGTARP